MKKKRLALVLLLLALPAALIVVVSPYTRQFVFGPKIQGTPLCAWQDAYRRSRKVLVEESFIHSLVGWFRRGNTSLDWTSLSAADKEVLLLSLLEDPEALVRRHVVAGLDNLSSETTLPAFLTLFDDADEQVRRVAAGALCSPPFKEESVLPKVRKFLDHPHPHRRYLAVNTICEIKPRSRATFVMLLRMLNDPDALVRADVAARLAVSPKGVASVKDALPRLKRTLLDPDPRCRLDAARAIWNVDKQDRDFLTVLLKEMKNGAPEVQQTAIDYLMLVKDGPPAAFLELVALATQNEHRRLKCRSVHALGKCGRSALPLLISLLEQGTVREEVFLALADMGPEAEEAIPIILQRIKEFGDGLDVLSRIKSKDSIAGLVALLDEPNDDWRTQVVMALGDAGPAAREAVPRLLPLLKDPQDALRAKAAVALGKIGEDVSTVVPALLGMLREDKEEIHLAAAEAVAHLGPRAKEAAPLLIKMLDKKGSARIWALGALAEIGPEAGSAIPTLLRLLTEDARLADMVVRALEKIGRQSERTVPALVSLLREDTGLVRMEAIRVLGRFGPQAKEAVPALMALLDEDDVEINAAAKEALSAIDQKTSGKDDDSVQNR